MQLALRRPVDVAPPRMGPLAKLPIFLGLEGKRCVVAGGTPGASWKAELLAAAGAHVQIYASEPSDDTRDLLARGAAAGRLTLHRTEWSPAALVGANLALADLEDTDEARAFVTAAHAAGAVVNIIDKPELCDFQFGTIVNRSPVVIGISTDGAAPILGQAIRRRIETLLPPSLADWGRLAQDMRGAVMTRLAKGPLRRAFWERLVEKALSGAPVAEARSLLRDIETSGQIAKGRVTLVGAGPGDAELLTLKAVRALQSADVILFDDLVSGEVLELARREAKRMAVGKRGQRESCAQGDINALMLKLAQQGKHVVRLKSGDPMIFGRAGEEIAALAAQGIAVDVVPGITSALAAAASLGVSLTHRDCAQSVRFVTGHARDGELPKDLDWRGLADAATTLVFYMGGRTAPLIGERLIAAGLSDTTPVALVAAVTQCEERRWCGSLRSLASGGAVVETGQPVLVGIGKVFASITNDCAIETVNCTASGAMQQNRSRSPLGWRAQKAALP